MKHYLFRRLTQMVPTVFGVILITFILFNIVGGSPALMALGEKAAHADLEVFDEVRGFNKPLFFGFRVKTRVYEDSAFKRTAGPWHNVEGVVHTNGMIWLPSAAEFVPPLAFSLCEDLDYEWIIDCREDKWFSASAGETALSSPDWNTVKIRFHGDRPPAIKTGVAALQIRELKLRRVVKNPFNSQLAFYLNQIIHFDFGVSSSTNQRVSKLLADGIVPSLMLMLPIFFAGLVTSVVLALLCAFWRNTWVDRTLVLLSVALMSINYLVWIVVGQYLLAYKLGWFPVWGFEGLPYLALPVIIGVVSGLGGSLRFYRTVMLDEMHRDYVRTAFAKGVSKSGVLFKHVLKNAMIPIVTNTVIAIPFLYTGSLLLESFFGIPGLGYLSINAINSSDVDVVRAVVLIGAILFVIANLLTDLCYAAVDPRVKLK